MDKYVSGRQRKLQVGLSSYSEGTQVVEVIGRVGIGSTVFGAQYDLDVRGNVNLGANSSNLINIPGRISSNLNPDGDGVYDIGRQQIGGAVNRWKDAHFLGKGTFNAGVSADDIEIGVTSPNLIKSTSGNLELNSTSGTTNVDDNLTVSGNTGIGTANPTSKLWVEGDGHFTGVVTASNFYVGNNVVGSGGSLSTLYVSGISTFANGPLLLGGNLGIGSTNPSSKLWVNGDGYFAGVVTASNFYVADTLVGVKISLGELYVGGISTFATGPVLIGYGSSGGNLGIGTTNPTSRLWVNGNSYFSGIITAGNIDALDINVRNINASGIVTVTNGPVLIGGGTSTGTASQRLQVTGGAYVSGSVGIGTTNPVNTLQVFGGLTAGDGSSATTLQSGFSILRPNDSTPRTFAIVENNTDLRIGGGAWNNVNIRTAPSNDVRVAITSSGNIGIGTTNPQVKLDISGDIRVSSGSTFVFGTGLGVGATAPGYTYALSNPFTSVQIGGTVGRTGNALVDIRASNYPDATNVINIQTTSETYTGTIGTYKPYTPAGTVIELGNTRASQRVGIGSTLFGRSAALISIYAYNDDNVTNAFFGAVAGDVQNGPSNFVFGRRTGAFSWEETVRIDTSGNLGIGTTNPTSKLTVIGDTYISGILTATDINSASDIRLKTNIKPFENTLEKIVHINGVSFNWIENNAKSGGIIAQDVEKVFPELVNGGDHKTVNYNGLIGVLVESIKELKQEIEDLKSRFNCI